MPEGDTIHYAAKRVREIVAGRVPDELLTPHPRFAGDPRTAGPYVVLAGAERVLYVERGAGLPRRPRSSSR